MTNHTSDLEKRIELESRDYYPGVLEQISDCWRLIISDLWGDREVEFQVFEEGEWVRFIGEPAEGLLDLPEDFGMTSYSRSIH